MDDTQCMTSTETQTPEHWVRITKHGVYHDAHCTECDARGPSFATWRDCVRFAQEHGERMQETHPVPTGGM